MNQDPTLPPLIGKLVILRELNTEKFNGTMGNVLEFDYDRNRFLVETDVDGLKFFKASNCSIANVIPIYTEENSSVDAGDLSSKIKALGKVTKFEEGLKILNLLDKNRSIENTSEAEFFEKINFFARMTNEDYIFDPKMQQKFIRAFENLANQTTHFPFAHLYAKIQLANTHCSSNHKLAYDLLAPHLEHHYGLLPMIAGILLSYDSDYHQVEKYMDLYYRTKECIASKNYSFLCRPNMNQFYIGALQFIPVVCETNEDLDRKKLYSEMDSVRNMVLKNDIENPYPIAYSYFVEQKFKQCLYYSKASLKWRSENGHFDANSHLLIFMFHSYFYLRNKEGAKKCLKQLKKIRPVKKEMKLFNSAPDHYWSKNSNDKSTKYERNLRQCGYFYCKNIESKKGEFKKCNACKVVYYCSKKCQKKHWKNGHKKECSARVI